jgi:phage baseplate assembly protein W
VIFILGVFIKNNRDTIFIVMANGTTYGLSFPFRDSFDGKYLDLSDYSEQEIRNSLIHLLLTRKGTRYYLPDFGTRLYEFIFEPLDGPTFSEIETEIREAAETYMPNLKLTNVSISAASDGKEDKGSYVNGLDERVFRVPGIAELEHTAKVRIDYVITDSVFNSSDFVIINI